MIIVLNINYEDLAKYMKPLYVINLVLLGAVIFMGDSALGAQRWIEIGPFRFQLLSFPSLLLSFFLLFFSVHARVSLINLKT
jgi:rod shape determining protein RodA